MTTSFDYLTVARDVSVATILLNRPERLNAISFRMADELTRCVDALEADDEVKVIVVTGNGDRAFSAGGDMEDIAALLDDEDTRGIAENDLSRLATCRKPTIAAVNGIAYGGGAVLAINCDLRICSREARFRFVSAAYGLLAGAARLSAIVGPSTAKDLLFTTRVIESEEALAIGLADRVVPAAELRTEAVRLAGLISEQSPGALSAAKSVIDEAASLSGAEESERAYNQQLRQSEDHKARFRRAAEEILGNRRKQAE